jgi:hypothetical protein
MRVFFKKDRRDVREDASSSTLTRLSVKQRLGTGKRVYLITRCQEKSLLNKRIRQNTAISCLDMPPSSGRLDFAHGSTSFV